MWKQQVILFIFILAGCSVFSQEQYELKTINGLNTANDDIAFGMYNDQLLFTTNGRQDLVNDYKWNKHNTFHLETATRGRDFSVWTASVPLFPYSAPNDEGPGTYNAEDSLLYFSSANNYGKTKGNNIKIFSVRYTNGQWGIPEMLPLCNGSFDYAHPWYDPEQDLLVYSSNCGGGLGQMDIWYCYKTGEGWTEPVNCGMMVNGAGNEIFPTVASGEIYYSSNSGGGPGGYDLRKALRIHQWKSSVMLEAPFNSVEDDVCLFFLSEDKALLSSNRSGGAGGDDVYVVERTPRGDEIHHYGAQLFCDGKPLSGAKVVVTNLLRETIIEETTDAEGRMVIAPLRLNQRYRMQLFDIDPGLYTKCILYITDEQGNRVKEIRFNAMGICDLELLLLNYADLKFIPLEDQSLLTIDVEGQLYEAVPGDIGRGEPITILDDRGDAVAIAYTNETGKFRFTDLTPRLEYNFKLSDESRANNVLITSNGEQITLPVLGAEIHYQRTSSEGAIALVNEYDEIIYVSTKDIFVINRIYYEYNSTRLTSEAKSQLDQLVMLMEKNSNIRLELRSHTDSRGSDDYNLLLSKKRADAAVKYMTTKKIAASRFTATGLGETALLNECDDGIECVEQEHTINRRTEIKLIRL